MNPPDELMVEEFLPSMRQLVSRSLRASGMSQGKIASALGVTQASVSNYLSRDPGQATSALSRYALAPEEAERYANMVAEELTRSPAEGVRALLSIWTHILGRGDACQRHRETTPSLADCDVCLSMFGGPKGGPIGAVADVADAVRLLESSSYFPGVMPEVGVNVAATSGDSEDPREVVAVPGRLVNVRGRARSMLSPERGASSHLAKVLLISRRRRKEVRGCINMKFDAKVGRALKSLQVRYLRIPELGRSGLPDPTVEALEAFLAREHGRFDALVYEGAKGVEPSLYVFGESAKDAAELALRIAAEYSAGQRA